MFLKCRFSNVSVCGFHVNRQFVEVSKCAMHLGHSISSEIVKYAKISFWSNYFILYSYIYLLIVIIYTIYYILCLLSCK